MLYYARKRIKTTYQESRFTYFHLSKFSECVEKYLEDDGLEHPEFTKTVMDDFPDEPAYRKCRSTLNSSAKLESLVLINYLWVERSKLYWSSMDINISFVSRPIQLNGSHRMVDFSTSSIHGQNMSKLVQSCDIVHMRSWLFMVYCTQKFRSVIYQHLQLILYTNDNENESNIKPKLHNLKWINPFSIQEKSQESA